MQRLPRIRSLISGLFGSELSAAAPAGSGSLGFRRHLYSASSLGLDNYIGTRQRVQNYLVDNGDKFRSKMLEFCDDDDAQRSMIFTEDLKNMVHIVENTPADLDLTVRMIKKFNAQNKEVRFGNFIFGPIVMRMFHHLGAPQLALDCFLAPELSGFFDQLISYQLLVDALYEAGQYAEVRQVFDAIRERQLQGGQYPKHVLVLVFAACYRENTAAAYEYSTRLWRDLNTVGHVPMRKAVTFAAALALAQGAPHVALEIVGTVRQQGYVTVRNLKVLALAQLGRADDALPVLRSVLEQQHAYQDQVQDQADAARRQTFSGAVLEAVRAEVAKSADRELQQTYEKLERALRDGGHVSDDTTLESMLCTEIVSTANNSLARNRDRGLLAASYERRGDDQQQQRWQQRRPQYQQQRYDGREEQRGGGGGFRQRPPQSRPGLTDLY